MSLVGTLGVTGYVRRVGDVGSLVDELLGIDEPAWTSFSAAEIYDYLTKRAVAAFVIRGISARECREIHTRLLAEQEGYLGVIEVLPSALSWVIYDSLPAKYRIVGEELRILHYDFETQVEDNRDHEKFNEWRRVNIFSQVSWEDMGVQGTIFDPYQSFEHAQTSAELEELVAGQFSIVVDEIFLRFSQLDPRLIDQLHGALKAFEGLNTPDACAHIAVSSRRLLKRLADALYPPRTELVRGREVGEDQYRNRLWMFVEDNVSSESERKMVLATLNDVGNRVDRIDSFANRGVHAEMNPVEAQRLLIALIALVYDLLNTVMPALRVPDGPYTQHVMDMAKKMFRHEEESR